MQSILFIKTSSLGDVIHQMPAVTQARQHFPDAHFAWAVEEAFAPLVALHPAVDEVIAVASRRWRYELLKPSARRGIGRLIATVRSRRYDAIVDTQGLVRSAVLARLARGRRHGYDRESVRERFAALFYDVRHGVPRAQHAIARNLALTALALGYVPQGPIDYGLDRNTISDTVVSPYAIACMRPPDRKQWPEETAEPGRLPCPHRVCCSLGATTPSARARIVANFRTGVRSRAD
jgi:heptosyltransferase-1